MEKVVNLIKNNKVKFSIGIILIIVISIGVCFILKNKNINYSVEEVSKYNYNQVNKDGKYGVISKKGDILIEAIYDNIKIPNPEKDVFICKKQDKTIILNEKGQEILTQYEQVDSISINGIVSNLPYEKRVLKYKENGKYGLIDYTGKVIVKPIYEEIEGLENKESELIVKKDGKYGVINDRGIKLIKEEYDGIVADGYYTEENKYALSGYIISNKTSNGYRYGYLNYKLEKMLKIEYNEISRVLEINNGQDIYIIASKNGKFGVVKNNKTVINYDYQDIEYDANNNLFKLQRNLQFGVYDINGKSILPVQYKELDFKGVYIQALENGKEVYTYFNSKGDEIKVPKYTSVLKTTENNYYITINKEGLYGIINKDEKELVENKYNYLEYLFDEYFIAAKNDGNLGIINAKDSILVDFKYEVLQKIQDTKVVEAKVLKENVSELYGKDMEKIYSVDNAYIYKKDNYIEVYSEKDTKYFDLEGTELVAQEIFKNNKLFAKKINDKWGFANKQNNIVVEAIYDKVTEFNSYGFAGIKKDNKWGVINEAGNVIIEPIYNIEETNTEPEFLGQYYKIYYGYGESYYTNYISE
ncbi:MAG: WG repeat-containing protein [Clostridia bacterium]|nr:WG repeat-containing protein [Clostridia bacterium]